MILCDCEGKAAQERGSIRITPDPRLNPSLWSSTALAAGADAIFNRHPSELTARSVFIGAAVVIVFLYNRIRERQSIRSDLRGGVVVVIRPKDANLEGTALEQLPRSRMPWSQLGAPALWRTDRRAGRTTL